jgi:hypothetical protein
MGVRQDAAEGMAMDFSLGLQTAEDDLGGGGAQADTSREGIGGGLASE